MKIIYNNIIPVKGFKAMCLWPCIFVRRCASFRDTDKNHELIHGRQQLEMLLIFFLLWYVVEWAIRLIIYRNTSKAYRSISFEQEAYANEEDYCYLHNRKPFSWIHYLTPKK